MAGTRQAPGSRGFRNSALVAHVTDFDANPIIRVFLASLPFKNRLFLRSRALTEGARVCAGALDLLCEPHHSCVVTSVRAWVGAPVRRWRLGFSSITAERSRPLQPVGCTIDLAKVSGEKLSSWMSTIFLLGSTS